MFSQRMYVGDLLDFTRRRVRGAEGEPVTEERLTDVFHQPFAELVDEQNRELAENPIHQVRVAVEVLRQLLGNDDLPEEAEYRRAALNSLLAPWGLSRAELQAVSAARQGDEDEDETLITSVTERLGVASERIDELLTVVEDLTEERLEAMFGLPSTRRAPLISPDAPPKLLAWQREQLPEMEEDSDGEEGESQSSARRQAEQALEQTLQAAVDAAEAAALPRLRDILVTAVGAREAGDGGDELDRAEVINSLTRRLALDFGNSGEVMTTRLHKAAETLQTVLFGLRTGWFMQRQRISIFSDPHPVTAWRITFDEDYEREDFDEDWHWLGRYETWRSAFHTLVHPDAALLPELLEPSSPHHRPSRAFRTLIDRLRTATQLTPRRARQLANGDAKSGEDSGYLTQLSAEIGDELTEKLQPGEFTITEQLTDQELEDRRSEVRGHFQPNGNDEITNWLHDAPNWLKEIFYFVPLTLALHLQRSGQFLAALAWYRTIYAYNWERDRRKIFHGLTLEEDFSLSVSRETGTWLRQWLNPHDIASERGHAYTRFTLQCIIDCFLDFADAEFTAASPLSIARARSLYLTALDLLELPEMLPPDDPRAIGNPKLGPDTALENPAIAALRQHAKLSLEKLREGRNVAGLTRLQRTAEGAAAPFHRTVHARPTIYRYRVLIERAQRLVGIAQQIEASFLSAAEKADAEAYNLLQARQDLALSREQVEVQDLRVDEAATAIERAERQQERARELRDNYQNMIRADLNSYERQMIRSYRRAGSARAEAADLAADMDIIRAHSAISNPMQAFSWFASTVMRSQQVDATERAIYAETKAQMASFRASHERRREEWRRQQGLAEKEIGIGQKQIALATQQHRIAAQERSIARLRTDQAAVTVDFLANKFTNAELYEWMSGVLNRVYRFFLQQATAMAFLAQDQLAFERQEKLPGFIQHDYWRPPTTEGAETSEDGEQPDRRGLTGSARLLRDIYRLDQFAFKTRERKLELSQTFSLARLFPFEFEQFRQTGRLPFVTPMELFDRGFPGHYLRLIKRVSVSILALVPSVDGVRATLTNSGISRVVVGPDIFRTIEVQRSPELIAFTSPRNATGLFELRPDGELLRPFEGQGVDTTWQLEMPLAANAFDYDTLADVLITLDYTAQYSAGYRRQVVSRLDRTLEAERPYHFRQEFADAWYELHNPERSKTPMTIRFETRRSDFPPHLDNLRIEHLLLHVARTDGADFELPVASLRFFGVDGSTVETGGAQTVDGTISTRQASGSSWTALKGQTPLGEWELALPDTEPVRRRFTDELIEDILLVITFGGETPEWL